MGERLAAAPAYKDGDWWRIKVEDNRSSGCNNEYGEYLVKMEEGKPKVYGITPNNEKMALPCPAISRDLLNLPDNNRLLKYPLTINERWSHSYLSAVSREQRHVDMKVGEWKTIKTPKGEFGAFEISVTRKGADRPFRTYYYSPKVKAIIRHETSGKNVDRKVTLIDFNVSDKLP